MLFAKFDIALQGSGVAAGFGHRLVAHHQVLPDFGFVFGAPDALGFVSRIGAEDGVQKHVHRDISDFLHVALKAFAVAAVGVFKDCHFAFAVAAHDGESVFDRQGIEVNRTEFLNPLFGQVALGPGVDQVALN